MYDVLVYAAVNPHIPMILGVFLYCWIAIGFLLLREYWMAMMWFSYAQANIALAGYTFFKILGR